MSLHEPGWELYRSFLAVMRSGSLSAAARLLSMSQPTLGRHIESLERDLGSVLFSRSPQGLRPSPTALALLPYAESMEAAAATLLRAVTSHQADTGTVRVSASHVVGAELLPAMLSDFHRKYPRISIELVLRNEPDDLLRGSADIAVRMFRPTQEALVAKRIGMVPIGLFAHQRYVESYGLPVTADAIKQHCLIGYDQDTIWLRAANSMGISLDREHFSLRCDAELAQLSALRSGFGIAACQVGIARRDALLRPVLPQLLRFNLEMWLAMHKDLRSSPCVALLFTFLAQALGKYVEDANAG